MTAKDKMAQARAAARLAAVQALYQMELSGCDASDVKAQYVADGAVSDLDGDLAAIDSAHFESIVTGVLEHQIEIDRAIDGHLKPGWPMARLDPTLRAIFRAAGYELMQRSDIPRNVVIDQYINVGHAFFDADQTAFINGVLDAMTEKAGADGQDGQ
jgi:N utilization substance protein B